MFICHMKLVRPIGDVKPAPHIATAAETLFVHIRTMYPAWCEQITTEHGFRAEYTMFINVLARQKIFFRQSIEHLLANVVDSEFEMDRMLNNLDDGGWRDPNLELKLKARLSGEYEYDCYMAAVVSIKDVLEKLRTKLSLTKDKICRILTYILLTQCSHWQR